MSSAVDQLPPHDGCLTICLQFHITELIFQASKMLQSLIYCKNTNVHCYSSFNALKRRKPLFNSIKTLTGSWQLAAHLPGPFAPTGSQNQMKATHIGYTVRTKYAGYFY